MNLDGIMAIGCKAVTRLTVAALKNLKYETNFVQFIVLEFCLAHNSICAICLVSKNNYDFVCPNFQLVQ